MALPNLGRGGAPVYSPASATMSVNNGSTAVTFTGTALQSVNATTQAIEYAVGTGDVLVVSGVGRMELESTTDATHATLAAPWSAANQVAVAASGGVAGAAGWYIIRNSVPAIGPVAKAIADVLAIGSDASPNTSYTIDDLTARVKARLSGGQAQIAVGPTGTADASLKGAIQIDPATGIVTFPFGEKASTGVVGWRNRMINGGFRIWQAGNTGTIANGLGKYTADQWKVNNFTGVTVTWTKVTAPTGFLGAGIESAMQVSGTGVVVNGYIDYTQFFPGASIRDLDSQACSLAFDVSANTSAGAIAGQVFVFVNTALDNNTFSTLVAAPGFAIPAGTIGRVTVPLSAAQTAGIKTGAWVIIRFQQTVAIGNLNTAVGAAQFELGPSANAFEYRDVAVEKLMCQRFLNYVTLSPRGTLTASWALGNSVTFPEMLVNPTATWSGVGTRSNMLAGYPVFNVTGKSSGYIQIAANATGDAFAIGDTWILDSRILP